MSPFPSGKTSFDRATPTKSVRYGMGDRSAAEYCPEGSGQVDGRRICAAAVSAGVFGEACSSNGQQTSGGGELETTVTVGMAVADVHDQEQLGDLAAGIADVLLSLDIPGARKKIDLSFITPDSRGKLFFDLSNARNLRRQGVHGAAFLEAIGGLK